jgi:TATA-binding protein-associated factor
MILTTSIGGLGLNLTAANIVIMYDHNWNPSKDMQAIDRAHRLGQKKTVNVYRLITVNSIEEKLINLQTFKTYIANNVVDINKMGEKKINTESVMMSFEEFSKNKIEEEKKGKVNKKKKMGKLEELMNVNEEEEKEEEMQIEYLKHLIDINEKVI